MGTERVVIDSDSDVGRMRLVMVGRYIMLLEMSGDVSQEQGVELAKALASVLSKTAVPIQFFADLQHLENYHPSVRDRAVEVLLKYRNVVPKIHAFAESKIIRMAVAVANMALGGRVSSHKKLSEFYAALSEAQRDSQRAAS